MAQLMARDAADMWPEDPMLPFDWAARAAASPFAPIEDVVAAFGRGEIVVVVDDEDRENEGDLIMAAEHATTERDRLHGPPHQRRAVRADDRRAPGRSSQLPLMVDAQHRRRWARRTRSSVDAHGVSTGSRPRTGR